RGVVLPNGSFPYQQQMIEGNPPRLIGRPAAAIEYHDGIGIRVAQALGATVATGRFGAHMHIELVNDGPVTLLLEG
ncbi:D-aminoacyl-tRNA deacylase, partial [Nocardia cyriacigeorgica]|uniref:D-aminoacyl-tRNA deacylase n=1 Tax=Nocardia cyriacigeorgica TaxID=135487 RepID=UPI0024578FAE